MKTVIVTGGSRGIGAAIVEELASNNYNIVLNYNNSEQSAKQIQNELKENGINIEIFKNITQSEKIDIKFMAKLVYCFIIALSLISFAIVFEQLTISTCLSIYNNIS